MSETSTAWVFLPVLGAPLLHAPVLRWDLLPALRRPINRRLFGENKTWRGALVMTTGTVAASLVLDPGPVVPATAERAHDRRRPGPHRRATGQLVLDRGASQQLR